MGRSNRTPEDEGNFSTPDGGCVTFEEVMRSEVAYLKGVRLQKLRDAGIIDGD